MEMDGSSQINADFTCPLSIPSQPLDIRNWFSSYEYESPENDGSETQDPLEILGIRDEGHSSVAKQNDGTRGSIENVHVGLKDGGFLESETEKKYGDGDIGTTKRSSINANSARELEEIIESPAKDECSYRTIRNDCIQLNDAQRLPVKIERKCDDSDSREIDNLCSYLAANGNSVEDPDNLLQGPTERLKRKQSSRPALLEIYAEKERHHDVSTNGNNVESKVRDGMMSVERPFKKICSEGSKINTTANGFISTKKRENIRDKRGSLPSMSMSANHASLGAKDGSKEAESHQYLVREELKENKGILAENGQLLAGRSMALADSTNIRQAEELGNPGKWQCPRKRKPYVGPPLKQLRLEQWVRRVN